MLVESAWRASRKPTAVTMTLSPSNRPLMQATRSAPAPVLSAQSRCRASLALFVTRKADGRSPGKTSPESDFVVARNACASAATGTAGGEQQQADGQTGHAGLRAYMGSLWIPPQGYGRSGPAPTATPQGILPAGSVFTTVNVRVSITETSFEGPLAA